MADDRLFDIEWEGLDELVEEFEKMDEDFSRVAQEEYTEYAKLVEEGTRALAFKDESDLEESITSDEAEVRGDEITTEVGSSSKKALRLHEQPARQGTYPKYDNGAKFDDYYQDGLGLGTRMKPSWRGMRPGRKYMERAILATVPDYNKMLNRILDRTLDKS